MNTPLPNDWISAYADEELSEAERAAVEAHLEQSSEAQQELAEYLKLSELIKALPPDSPLGTDLSGSVMQQLERETLLGKPEPEPSGSRRMVRVISACATVACLLAVAIFLNFKDDTTTTENTVAMNHTEPETAVGFSTELDSFGLSETSDADLSLDFHGSDPRHSTTMSRESGDARLLANTSEGLYFDLDAQLEMLGNSPKYLYRYKQLEEADVGDRVDAWQVDQDEIIIVRLTVLDRKQGIDSLQVLLSDLNIPEEPVPEAEELQEAKDSPEVIAVYVESDPGIMKEALHRIQKQEVFKEVETAALLPTEQLSRFYRKLPSDQRGRDYDGTTAESSTKFNTPLPGDSESNAGSQAPILHSPQPERSTSSPNRAARIEKPSNEPAPTDTSENLQQANPTDAKQFDRSRDKVSALEPEPGRKLETQRAEGKPDLSRSQNFDAPTPAMDGSQTAPSYQSRRRSVRLGKSLQSRLELNDADDTYFFEYRGPAPPPLPEHWAEAAEQPKSESLLAESEDESRKNSSKALLPQRGVQILFVLVPVGDAAETEPAETESATKPADKPEAPDDNGSA